MIRKVSKILIAIIIIMNLSATVLADNMYDRIEKVRQETQEKSEREKEISENIEELEKIKNTIIVEEVNLTDISKHWAKDNIEYLVQRGGISGYPDGSFKPNNTISYAEFLKIALHSVSKPQSQGDGSHWASGVFTDAERLDIVKRVEVPQYKWNEPITRYEMTRIMTRIVENILGEKEVDVNGIANIMPDYKEVQGEKSFTYFVEQAYMKGLIAGKTGGLFEGNANGTRAEAATMVVRIIDKAKRVGVDISKPVVGSPQILKWNDPERPNAKEGDTFITQDGREIVLKIGPSGVLGENQNVAVDLYRRFPDGTLLKHGSLGTKAMGYPGETYLVDDYGEGHFWSDWLEIRQIKPPIQNPKDGQTYGKWWYAEDGEWYWVGPLNK